MQDVLRRLSGARCLVTGGAGAIGSNLVAALTRLGARATVLDNLSSGWRNNLDGLPNVTLVVGDVNAEEDVERAFAGEPQYVFHLAAHFANQNSIDHPLADCVTNANGTVRILDRCRSVSGLVRVLYASSSCVFGHQDGELSETSPVMPDTPYAVSKLAGEYYTRLYHRLFAVPTTVVRYFNVFGPGELPGDYRNVVPNFIKRALSGQPLVITGTGEETREFVFVGDAVKATLLAAAHECAVGDIFHVGSGEVKTVREVAEAVRAVSGCRVPIEFRPRRSWDSVRSRRTSFARAREVLGYQPETSFEDGLAATAEWLRALVSTPTR